METYNALEKAWIASFGSTDTELILKALYEVRNSGSVKILPEILKLVNYRSNTEIINEIISLISELKSPDAVPVIARVLKERDFDDYQNAIVAACWQSGLDFSSHLKVFAELFIQGDYRTALEAFTVIEESLGNATEDEIYNCINFLREAKCMVSDDKLPLYKELQKVVEQY
jgi:hypothetical protein